MIVRKIMLVLAVVGAGVAQDRYLLEVVSASWPREQAVALEQMLREGRKEGLPVDLIENKVWEGLAKRRSVHEILAAAQTRRDGLKAISRDLPTASPSQISRKLLEQEKSKLAPDRTEISLPDHLVTPLIEQNQRNRHPGDQAEQRLNSPTRGIPESRLERVFPGQSPMRSAGDGHRDRNTGIDRERDFKPGQGRAERQINAMPGRGPDDAFDRGMRKMDQRRKAAEKNAERFEQRGPKK